MNDRPQTITCSGAQLYYLSTLVGGSLPPGLPDPFAGLLAEEIDEARVDAQSSLTARQYVATVGDQEVVDDAVAAIMRPLASPSVALLVTRTIADNPEEQRMYYFDRDCVIEVAPVAPTSYQIRPLAAADAALKKISAFWRLAEQAAAPTPHITLTERKLWEVGQMAALAGIGLAESALRDVGVAPGPAYTLAEALALPRCSGALIVLRRTRNVWEVSGFGMLEGSAGLWRLHMVELQGKRHVDLIPSDATMLAQAVSASIEQFAGEPIQQTPG